MLELRHDRGSREDLLLEVEQVVEERYHFSKRSSANVPWNLSGML